MRQFDKDSSFGRENSRNNDNRRGGRRNNDFGKRNGNFHKKTEKSFDYEMRNPDNDDFSGKKVDKASKYYDAPEYMKKRNSEKRNNNQDGKFRGRRDDFKNRKEDFRKRANSNFDEEENIQYRKRKSDKPKSTHNDEKMRLNKYIANAGICSRREADTYIQAGLVTVNGVVVTELGTRVNPGDEVCFGGEKLSLERNVYILLNKPKNYVTTLDDPEERKTVMDLVKDACPERIYPVGRLDRNTTGLLLFTNDGDLTKKLTHPSYEKKKIYQVETDKNVNREDLQRMVDGFELEDGFIAADAVSYVGDSKNVLGIEIHSGRNRIVRRIFEHLGYQVKRLDRVYFAGLTKLNLPRGKWRFLTDKEINVLKSGMYE